MTFKYFQITPQIARPIIPLIIRSKDVVIIYSGLIDSGADYCIFDADIGRKLNIIQDNKINFFGVGRDKVEGFTGEVELRIGGISYTTLVVFAEISDFGHSILGHKGFFDHFNVNLRYKDLTIEVIPNSSNSN